MNDIDGVEYQRLCDRARATQHQLLAAALLSLEAACDSLKRFDPDTRSAYNIEAFDMALHQAGAAVLALKAFNTSRQEAAP